LHGPASHWPLPGTALRSARGNADQVVRTNQSHHLATLDAKESPFGGERHAHSSCHKECFHAGRPLLCMLNRVQLKHTHAACASICATRTIKPESSQLLGAMIMWSAGRDQHMKVRHRECCSMSSTAKSSFSSWLLPPDQLWVQPGARQSLKNPPAPDLSRGPRAVAGCVQSCTGTHHTHIHTHTHTHTIQLR